MSAQSKRKTRAACTSIREATSWWQLDQVTANTNGPFKKFELATFVNYEYARSYKPIVQTVLRLKKEVKPDANVTYIPPEGNDHPYRMRFPIAWYLFKHYPEFPFTPYFEIARAKRIRRLEQCGCDLKADRVMAPPALRLDPDLIKHFALDAFPVGYWAEPEESIYLQIDPCASDASVKRSVGTIVDRFLAKRTDNHLEATARLENKLTFFASCIAKPKQLVARLKKPNSAAEKYFFGRMQEGAKEHLRRWRSGSQVSKELQSEIVASFNSIIGGPSIWAEDRFEDKILRSKTKVIAWKPPASFDEGARLNRLLIEDVFVEEIVPIDRRNDEWLRETRGKAFNASDAKDALIGKEH